MDAHTETVVWASKGASGRWFVGGSSTTHSVEGLSVSSWTRARGSEDRHRDGIIEMLVHGFA